MKPLARAILLAALASQSCAAPPSRAPAAKPAAPALPAAAPAPKPIDASSVLGVLRVKDPSRAMQAWGGAASNELGTRLLSKLPFGATALDLSAPIDAIWAAESTAAGHLETRLALACGVRSRQALLDSARQSGTRVETTADGSAYFEAPSFACGLPAESGKRTARLVCGPSRLHVQPLLPYANSELPAETLGGADLFAELRLAPLRKLSRTQLFDVSQAFVKPLLNLQSRNQRFDKAGAEMAGEAAREVSLFIHDIDRAQVELTVAAETGALEAAFTLHWQDDRSRVVQSLLTHASHAGPAPEAFWQCPLDSTRATFVRGLAPDDFSVHKQFLGGLFGEALSYQGTPPKLQEMAAELVYAVPLPRGDAVVCAGAVDAGALAALPLQARDLALARERLGWRVFISNDEPDRYRSYLVKLLEAFQDPVLGPQLRRFIGAQQGELPLTVRGRPPAPGAGMPPGTRLVEMTLPAREIDPRQGRLVSGRAPGLRWILAVAPLAGRAGTLIAVGSDEKVLAAKMRVVGSRQASQTLAARRTELDPLTRTSAVAGGFWSVAALRSTEDGTRPGFGQTASVYTLEVLPGARRMQLRLSAPRAALSDLAALFSDRLQRASQPVGAEPR
ncbi:MAG TPA: hypothetical protein VK524_12665 [Polyangiaceae bacterium]|nr:hypothetical protein [Polyangiaceae bacterium]